MSKKDKNRHREEPHFSSPVGIDAATKLLRLTFEPDNVGGVAAFRVTGREEVEREETPIYDLFRSGVLGDLYRLDVSDRGACLDFMETWGLATSLARVSPFFPNREPSLALDLCDPLMTGVFVMYEPALYEAEAVGKTAALGGSFVAEREARAALENCQWAARTVIDAKMEGCYPKPGSYRENVLGQACRYVSRALSRYAMPLMPLGGWSDSQGSAPALAVALGDLCRAALDPEPVKPCKFCHEPFQYQRYEPYADDGTPRPAKPVRKRERSADYCSRDCRIKFNNALKLERRAAEREKATSNEKTAS